MAQGEIDKRRVVMRNVSLLPTGETAIMEATDYVRPDFLEEYLSEARSRWQYVEVSEEPDAGPGGYEGQTHIPRNLNHPDAGTTYAATNQSETTETEDFE